MKVYYIYEFPDPLWKKLAAEIGIWICCQSDRFFQDTPEINIWDRIRWMLEGIGGQIFSIGYANSGAELASALNGEIPWRHMNARQRAAAVHEFGNNPPLDENGCVDNSHPLYLLTWPEERMAA